jgi:hypothetical protein
MLSAFVLSYLRKPKTWKITRKLKISIIFLEENYRRQRSLQTTDEGAQKKAIHAKEAAHTERKVYHEQTP